MSTSTPEHARLPSPAIELRDVTKLYPGPVKALDSVSIHVEQGEHCCLLGPNGAGKTTIIRLLQGALAPSEGQLFILGEDVRGRSILEVKKRVGIVPQNPGMYPDLTVREYLQFVAALYGKGEVVDDRAPLRPRGLYRPPPFDPVWWLSTAFAGRGCGHEWSFAPPAGRTDGRTRPIGGGRRPGACCGRPCTGAPRS